MHSYINIYQSMVHAILLIVGYSHAAMLFKKIERRIRNSELIMFLTPTLIEGDKSFYEEEAPSRAVSEEMYDEFNEDYLYQKAKAYKESMNASEE